jgi:bifunctional DNA-binding transcriptional regulator/antitoxin component of YhaV-PrlF toxin-antitoxin module
MLFHEIIEVFDSMPKEGYRSLHSRGSITLPKDFREEHDLEEGDKVNYKRHSRDKSKLIIEVPE